MRWRTQSFFTDRVRVHHAAPLEVRSVLDQQRGGLDIRFYPGPGRDLDSFCLNRSPNGSRNEQLADSDLALDGAFLPDDQITC